jgi:Cof subfamily protein (haloacid dehalogenase superfamily)
MGRSDILVSDNLQRFFHSKNLEKFRMIALDMDGTLLNTDHQLTERTVTAVRNVEKAGLTVLLATGRMPSAVKNHLKKLGTSDLVVSHNGALVKGVRSGSTYYHKTISHAAIVKLLEVLEGKKLVVHFNFDDTVYLSQKNPYSEEYARDLEISLNYVHSLERLEGEPTTVVLMGTKNELVFLLKNLSCELDRCFSSVMVHWMNDVWRLQLRPPGISKGQAVLQIAEQLGIDPEEIISFGDNLNDIEMLASTGCGVAVGNAVYEAKQVADFITLPNSEDGVAFFFEAFLKNISKRQKSA